MAEEELFQARLDKVAAFRERGVEPWAVRFDPSHHSAQLQDEFRDLEAGSDSGRQVRVAGRLGASRVQGKIAFGDLVDATGTIQLFCTGDAVGTLEQLDDGDIVGAVGEVMRTKRGELSVRPERIELLSKALRPPPAKWHGLKDVETRFRQRYLDLRANPEARRIAELRTTTIRAMRGFFDGRDFLEVETPMLHAIPGGGRARPFETHHNALDADLYLRIATELYLKQLLVGGMERVYEIGRCFRNEGLGYRWNPEFTMLEAYQAYADYHDMMELTEALFTEIATETLDSTSVLFEGTEIDLAGPWPRVPMLDAVSDAIGERVDFERSVDDLRELCARHDVTIEAWYGHGHLINELYEKLVEPAIVQPTIICDYPLAISPLARTHRDNPDLVERFEVIVAGRELGNAFSELNDPIEQRKRFQAQQVEREAGDIEVPPIDEAYVRALEYGMPPAGGLGVGVDRLVMVLTGVHTIKEVILFPALRPLGDDSQTE